MAQPITYRRRYEVFGRKYELKISQTAKREVTVDAADMSPAAVTERRIAKRFTKVYESSPNVQPLAIENFNVIFTQHQIKATIKLSKSDTGDTPDFTVIDIYNVDEEDLATIGAGQIVSLSAGYEQDEALPLVYSGEIQQITTERRGVDKITTLYCSAYLTQRSNNIRLTRKWDKSVSAYTVLKDLLAYLGSRGVTLAQQFPPQDATSKIGNTYSPQGYAIKGNVFLEIEKIARSVGYKTYFSGGAFYLEQKYRPKLRTIIAVEEDAVKEFIKTRETWDAEKKEFFDGVHLKFFLDGEIFPSCALKIRDKEGKNTYYEVKKVTHYLDFEGDWWETEVEADLPK